MPTDFNKIMDWAANVSFAVTVCDCEGFILYMNARSKETFSGRGELIGKNLKECHSPKSWDLIQKLLKERATNMYTIDKKGVKKLIYQTPWYRDVAANYRNNTDCGTNSAKELGGLVEISIVINNDMPHYIR